MNFGRHRGERLAEVVTGDPNYLYWVSGSDSFGPEVRKIAESAGNGYLPEREPKPDLESSTESEPTPEAASGSEPDPEPALEPEN